MRARTSLRVLACLAVVPLLALGCKNTSFFSALGDKTTVVKLSISPVSATIPVNGNVTFSVSGGVPPYTFSLLSGPGSISSAGVYTASATAGPVSIEVRDVQGNTATASLTVTSSAGPLTLTPPSVTLNAGGSVTFIATGGTPPYTFSLQTIGTAPPAPSINASTGAYVAGSTVGSDTVKVTDGTGLTSTGTVNVTAAVTNVDYSISSETLPSGTVTGGTALAAGYSFSIKNGGSAGGTQSVSWWVFLSPTTSPGSGTVILQRGTTAALAAGGSTTIPLSWIWPTVPPVLPGATRYLYILISAADDLTTSNNAYSDPTGITVAPPNVDYTVTSVSSTGSTVAGTGITGTFTLQNAGTANGSPSVGWTAYVSTNSTATIDASCMVISSGSTGALAAAGSQAVGFAGTWPSTAGTYYLKVAVSAGDDVNTTNNVQVSAAYLTTYVDYAVTAVNNTGSLYAGGAAAGNFTVKNAGTASGSQTVSWNVYASPTATLGAGSIVIASSTTTPLSAGASTSVTFSGAWPTTPGTYYLIAAVSASDDVNSANNSLASAALSVTAANVNYAVASVTNTGGSTNPAGSFTGSFQLSNLGPNNGTQYVSWQVYASLDATLSSNDVLVASGNNAPLAAGALTTITFNGTWPLKYGVYYLIATASAPVDVDTNTANNTTAGAATTQVGIYNAASFEPANNLITTAPSLGVTLQPGMSIELVGGSLTTTDTTDIFGFNTGTATTVTFAATWGTSANMAMYVENSLGTVLGGVSITAYTSLSMIWSVDLASTMRYVNLTQSGLTSAGGYTLIITAN